MSTIRMRVADVPENAVLAQHVLWQRKILVSKGSVLTGRVLSLLSRRDVQFIYIEQRMQVGRPSTAREIQDWTTGAMPTVKQDLSVELDILNSISVPEVAVAQTEVSMYRNEYLRALAELQTEVRYGQSLKHSEDIDFVRDLFVMYMQQEPYRKCLVELHKRDHYTYLHAIDVFTLSILFMKKQGIQQFDHIGIGFLLHDVGKLRTPIDVLKKRGQLTKPEFELMKRHTIDGHDILCELGAGHVAYLALSHHERVDGSGYPQKLKLKNLRKEVRILQLIDMYSAITLTRSYKVERSAADAIKLLYQDKHLLDEELLANFIDFLGIYPENSLVFLSNGFHATVEKVNELYPLLPTVRVFETGTSFALPIDFQVSITKLISYNVDTPEQLFLKLSESLINYNEEEMEAYYAKLKEHYRTFEWFTHLYIPIYQIFHVLQTQKVVEEMRILRGGQQLSALLMKTNSQLRQLNTKNSHALLVVDPQTIDPLLVALLEGVLHTEGIYSIVMNHSSDAPEMQRRIAQGNFKRVFALGDTAPMIDVDQQTILYHFTEKRLQQMLFHFSSIRPLQVNLVQEMDKYKMRQQLINHA